jgi:hypothetical protein
MRITSEELEQRPERTARRLRAALQSSSATRAAGTAPSRSTDHAPVSS